MGCAMSWYDPSGFLRLGIATNMPFVPSMILSPRTTNAPTEEERLEARRKAYEDAIEAGRADARDEMKRP